MKLAVSADHWMARKICCAFVQRIYDQNISLGLPSLFTKISAVGGLPFHKIKPTEDLTIRSIRQTLLCQIRGVSKFRVCTSNHTKPVYRSLDSIYLYPTSIVLNSIKIWSVMDCSYLAHKLKLLKLRLFNSLFYPRVGALRK